MGSAYSETQEQRFHIKRSRREITHLPQNESKKLAAAPQGEITDPRALHPSSSSWLFWHFSNRSIQAVHFLRVQIFIILIMLRDRYMEAFIGPESIFTVPVTKHFWKTLFHLIVGADSSGAASERLMLHMFESSNSKQRILHWFLALVVFITPGSNIMSEQQLPNLVFNYCQLQVQGELNPGVWCNLM